MLNITLPQPGTKQPATRKSPAMMVLYGPPKVGKTTELAKLEGNLTIDVEDGSDFLEMTKVKAQNWEELQQINKQIRESGKPYKITSYDTATRLEEWAEQLATERYKMLPIGKNFKGTSILELDHGAGYLHLRNAFIDIIMSCKSTADRVIFVCHLRDKLIGGKETKTNTTVSSKDLELTGKCKQIICSMADAIGYVYRNPENPAKGMRISFQSSEMINCGSRCEHLKGVDMDLDWNKIYVD